MSWEVVASGLFASCPTEVEGPVRVVAGIKDIIALMRESAGDPAIIVTNVAGGSAVSTIIKRAKAIISTIGGPNSHIVVVARDYQVPCIVGASGMNLAGLAEGTPVRLHANGQIDLWREATAPVSEAHIRVLRNIAFAGAVASAEEIIGAGADCAAAVLALQAAGFLEPGAVIVSTPAGLAALDRWYAGDRSNLDSATRDRMHVEFRPLDVRLKATSTDWQRADAADDWDARLAAVESLSSLHADMLEFIERHRGVLPRLEEYRERLSRALARVVEGQTEYVAQVHLDSYHTVWFQWHEDILRLLERARDPE